MPNSEMKMVYRFFKPGFCLHQSDKLISADNRKAILLDKNFATHPKVLMLAAKGDPVLVLVLIHIWSRLDLESGSWCQRVNVFDFWLRRTFCKSNRFNVKAALEALEEADLLGFQIVPIDEIGDHEIFDG